MKELTELLDYLEEILDIEHLTNTKKLIKDCLEYKDLPRQIIRVNYDLNLIGFKPITYTETTTDMAKMMYSELRKTVPGIEVRDDSIPMIRADYGVGTLPSLFGLNSRIINDNLPWVDHLNNISDVKNLIDKGVPDLNAGFGQRVIETYEYYNDILNSYPKCKEHIKLYHADLQGPFDVAHLIMGSDIYLAIYDDPDLVLALMELVSETYIQYMKKLKPYLNDEYEGCNYHWYTLYGGQITLRNDSAVNLSLDCYREFVKPFDQKIIDTFGGASIHFCGRADQWVLDMAEMKGLKAMNFGYMPNKEFGEKYLEFIMPVYEQLKLPVAGYTIPKEELSSFDFNKYRTGITYATAFDSKKEAMYYMDSIR